MRELVSGAECIVVQERPCHKLVALVDAFGLKRAQYVAVGIHDNPLTLAEQIGG